MKTKFTLGVMLLMLTNVISYSQGINFIENSTDYDQYFLVGTLGHSSVSVKEKLKVEVFGGNWHSDNIGEDIYYISTRGSIMINRERHGGSTSKYTLEIYDNGASYDFVIHTTTSYPAIQIKSWYLNGTLGTNTNTEFTITSYNPTGKTNITSQHPITDIFTTSYSGNVGIGATNPTEKLTVDGKILAEEVKVQNVPQSDYVFEPDYNLPSLSEVEAHINEKKHLPGIPSAEEFRQNGVGLGEMDDMLLRKIEELTLYVIEQNKRIAELETENNEQGKIISKQQAELNRIKNEY